MNGFNKGLFITLEGHEGTGKTTQIKLLSDALINSGWQVQTIKEPGGTSVGDELKTILKQIRPEPIHPETELFLFQASRAQLVRQVIKPALTAGKIVLSDRFHDSTWVYQGWYRGINLASIEYTNRLAMAGAVVDKTFLFNLPVVEIKKRVISRGGTDRFESEGDNFYLKINEGYEELMRYNFDGRIETIDANRSVEEIHVDLLTRVNKLIEERVKHE